MAGRCQPWLGGIVVCWLLFAFAGMSLADAADIRQLDQAQMCLTGNVDVPPQADDGCWQKVSLPDLWQLTHRDYGGNIWYRLSLQVDEAPRVLWGIYLPLVSMNATVSVNGQMAGSGGSFVQPVTHNWNHPLYFTVPKKLWQTGDNTILVRVYADANCRGALYPFSIGPDDLLRPVYQRALFWKIDVLGILAVLSLCTGVMTLVLWLLRNRRDAMYGWYALGTLCWAGYIQYFYVSDIPVASDIWMWLTFSCGYFMTIAIMLFCQRYMQLSCPWCVRVIPVLGMVLSLLLYLVPLDAKFDVIGASFAILMVFILYLLAHLMRYMFRVRDFETLLLGSSVLVNVAFGIHDLLSLTLVWAPPNYMLHYGSPAMLLAMGVILLNRFRNSLQIAESMNVVLDERVKQRERELAVLHEEVREAEKHRAVLQERERIMADLHDGLGGQMVAAIALAEEPGKGGVLRELLQDSMRDFRLVIDSLDEEADNMISLLASLRMRMQPCFEAAGTTLRWRTIEGPACCTFVPEHALQILRIIQEALTNAVRHARASEVEMIVDASGRRLTIMVRDNGTGFQNETEGHGLRNMRKRAQKVAADLDMHSVPGEGVTVCLSCPG